MEDIIKRMQNLSQKYRPLPFWSWNDRLEPDRLREQIAAMAETGMGGYFMHARGGLETEYLSDEWMECIAAGIAGAKQHRMAAWIYDEVGWPSGFAGGLVTALGDRYHARGLHLEVREGPDAAIPDGPDLLGVYRYDLQQNQITVLTTGGAMKAFSALNEKQKLLIVRHSAGAYYIDVLNRDVVREFIRQTHEKYYARFGADFGHGLQGFFTDEPRLAEGEIPWSYIIPEQFRAKFGYDILPCLPLLFLDAAGYQKVRYDFWSLVNELFTTAYMRQLYEWCEAHHCQLTGHVMMEESLYSQMTGTSGSMPFYQYMHIPGVDWLRRPLGNPIVAKQVGSVASQLGKEQVITESYALSGWNISFEELKWLAEWQYVNGVNLLCQHLEAYTLRGLRKRDYPPSLFIQQSWWPEYAAFTDYIAKLGWLLSTGRGVVPALLLHPMHSAWLAYDGTNNETLRQLDADLIWAAETLSGLHVDYHFGDESILAQQARVASGRFVVGRCEYRIVILPSLLMLDGRTLDLLEEWLDSGGTVLSIGTLPRWCPTDRDGRRLEQFAKRVTAIGSDRDELDRHLKTLSIPRIRIADSDGEITQIRYQQRDWDDCQLFFLANQDRDQSFAATVTFPPAGRVSRLILEEDRQESLPALSTARGTTVDLQFLPMQSQLLLLQADTGVATEVDEPTAVLMRRFVPDSHWEVERMDWNSLTLDTCSYRIDDGEWREPLPVIKLMTRLLEMQKTVAVELKFTFDIELDLSRERELFMAIETPENFEIYVNNHPVAYREAGWWRDSAFKKVDIRPRLQPGRNEIVLKNRFYQDSRVYQVLFGKDVYETEKNKLTFNTELESIYIVGEFGVVSRTGYTTGERRAIHTEGPFVIVEPPRRVTTGDLTSQGLPFFAGKIRLTQAFTANPAPLERWVLQLERPDAVLTKVCINGQLVKRLLWAPYTVDLTAYLRPGENQLAIELFSGNRNLLGPHHHCHGEIYNVGPSSFSGEWSWVERSTEGVRETPDDRSANYWQEGYWLVRFGFN